MRKEVENVFQLPKDKIRVIHNGVDLDRLNGYERDWDYRRRFALDNEKIVFFVGRLVNEKGVHILMDAIPKILSHYHDCKFVIAGKGPQLDFLKGKAMEMNISHKVYFTGYISDEELCRLYRCVDMAVFPSLYEPFGIVALESIVANIPIVVSDTGGLGEIVIHGVDGMKAYPGNSNSISDCIMEILFNPQKAEEMKRKALEKVNNQYNWNIISQKTMEVYNEIIKASLENNWSSYAEKDFHSVNIYEDNR
jgi:glycosyltransferase involved in cell wall biosynthesis